MTEDEMVGWHCQLNGHEFEQALGDSEGQGSLACCRPWGCEESDMAQRLNDNNKETNQKVNLRCAVSIHILQVKKQSIRDMKLLPEEHRDSWWRQDLNLEKADFKSSSFHCCATQEARDCTSCLLHTQLRAWIPGKCLGQGSPTFSAPGTGFVEDNFSMEQEG